jgi:hypothetical protein
MRVSKAMYAAPAPEQLQTGKWSNQFWLTCIEGWVSFSLTEKIFQVERNGKNIPTD